MHLPWTYKAAKCSQSDGDGWVDVSPRDATTDISTQTDADRPGLRGEEEWRLAEQQLLASLVWYSPTGRQRAWRDNDEVSSCRSLVLIATHTSRVGVQLGLALRSCAKQNDGECAKELGYLCFEERKSRLGIC